MPTESTDRVLFDIDGPVARITLNGPPHNFYDDAVHQALIRAWTDIERDSGVRVAILRSQGKNFCGGHDVEQVAITGHEHLAVDLLVAQTAVAIPTIAAVQGACVGGGLRFAWACDLIYAADDAYFRDPTVAMGRGGIGLFDSVWDYGPRLAKEMLFTGKGIGARRLEALGAVNAVVDRDVLWSTVDLVADRIASMPREAIREAKAEVQRAAKAGGRGSSAQRFAEIQLNN